MSNARNDTGNAPLVPDWVSPPGDTILDLLEERDWTQQQLADRLGFSLKHVNQLIKGKVSLTEDAAIRLRNVLGASIGFWLTREAQYRERAALLAAAEHNAAATPWLELFPLNELMEVGALVGRRPDGKIKPEMVGELLAFFGVASPAQWEGQYASMQSVFRRSHEDQDDVAAISAWLRLGERAAEQMDTPRYNETSFRQALGQISTLTTQAPEQAGPRLRSLLNAAGVTLVVVAALPRSRVSALARWLNAHRPVIQLSLGKSTEQFWFSLFHEAAHILLHSKQKTAVFLDDPGRDGAHSIDETEANAWAREQSNGQGRHLSAFEAVSDEQIKDTVSGRKIHV
ncbi:MAG: helix-turn-helix domain-containing protein [Pseudomonadota bacterium]